MNIKEAIEYSKKYNPKKDKEYKWVYEHAKEQYDRVEHIFRTLDNKADSMIKYLSPTSGILGIALTYITSYKICSWISYIGLAGIFFIVIAVVLATLSLKPRNYVLLPSIRNAIEAAEYYENDNLASVSFATGIGIAVAQNMESNEFKAKFTKWSYWFFAFAVFLLFFILPFIYIVGQFSK